MMTSASHNLVISRLVQYVVIYHHKSVNWSAYITGNRSSSRRRSPEIGRLVVIFHRKSVVWSSYITGNRSPSRHISPEVARNPCFACRWVTGRSMTIAVRYVRVTRPRVTSSASASRVTSAQAPVVMSGELWIVTVMRATDA